MIRTFILPRKLTAIFLSCCTFIGCEKFTEAPGTASLTIVNTTAGSRPLIPRFNYKGLYTYNKAARFQYNAYDKSINQLRSYNGEAQLKLFQYPDTSDKDSPLFDLRLSLPVGSINTLFLTGTTTAPDTLLIKEEIPFLAGKDSVMALRFINLSPGSRPVSVNLKNEATQPANSHIPYRGITGFQFIPVLSRIREYVFEFRDAETGELLASHIAPKINIFYPANWLFRSHTLAFTGLPGGTGSESPGTVMVSHF